MSRPEDLVMLEALPLDDIAYLVQMYSDGVSPAKRRAKLIEFYERQVGTIRYKSVTSASTQEKRPTSESL